MIVRPHMANGKQDLANNDEDSVKTPHKAPEFQARLLKLMKTKGFDAPKMAAASGIPQRSVTNYMNKSEPPISRGLLIAKVLGVDPYELVGTEKPAPAEVRERAQQYKAQASQGSVDPTSSPPEKTYKEVAGYFDFQDLVIKASMMFEVFGKPGRFGGYTPNGPDDDGE